MQVNQPEQSNEDTQEKSIPEYFNKLVGLQANLETELKDYTFPKTINKNPVIVSTLRSSKPVLPAQFRVCSFYCIFEPQIFLYIIYLYFALIM